MWTLVTLIGKSASLPVNLASGVAALQGAHYCFQNTRTLHLRGHRLCLHLFRSALQTVFVNGKGFIGNLVRLKLRNWWRPVALIYKGKTLFASSRPACDKAEFDLFVCCILVDEHGVHVAENRHCKKTYDCCYTSHMSNVVSKWKIKQFCFSSVSIFREPST